MITTSEEQLKQLYANQLKTLHQENYENHRRQYCEKGDQAGYPAAAAPAAGGTDRFGSAW